jgi:hypothetical protein
MNWLGRFFGRKHPLPAPGSPITLDEEYPFQVVGDFHYQEALREIVENSDDPGTDWQHSGAHCRVSAWIVPEEGNSSDPLAVRIEIDGQTVGHLCRADARRYQQLMCGSRVPVAGLIVGGGSVQSAGGEATDSGIGYFGVRLAFSLGDRYWKQRTDC